MQVVSWSPWTPIEPSAIAAIAPVAYRATAVVVAGVGGGGVRASRSPLTAPFVHASRTLSPTLNWPGIGESPVSLHVRSCSPSIVIEPPPRASISPVTVTVAGGAGSVSSCRPSASCLPVAAGCGRCTIFTEQPVDARHPDLVAELELIRDRGVAGSAGEAALALDRDLAVPSAVIAPTPGVASGAAGGRATSRGTPSAQAIATLSPTVEAVDVRAIRRSPADDVVLGVDADHLLVEELDLAAAVVPPGSRRSFGGRLRCRRRRPGRPRRSLWSWGSGR